VYDEDQPAWVRKLRQLFLLVCLGRDANRRGGGGEWGGGDGGDVHDDPMDDPTGATEDAAGGARGIRGIGARQGGC